MTIGLLAALAMLIMMPLSLDELVEMGQFLVLSRRAGKSTPTHSANRPTSFSITQNR